jgi:hypothetical protein
MRQHSIPQNILDVEFKPFTKFTLKEFAYLAIGIGFGGVFLYLFASNKLPGIIGVPLFVVCSLAGIILGLVPINDQDADVFVKNYINAITNPTQRVWLNKEMKKDRIKPDVKPTQDGKLVQKDSKSTKKKIIGGNILGEENIQENSFKQEPTSNKEVDSSVINMENTEPTEEIVSTKPIDPNLIQINDDNIKNYQVNIKTLDKLPGNINIWLSTKDTKAIPNVISYMRDNTGKILYANKTGPNGYFLTNKLWEPGLYTIEFQHPQFKFPKVEISVSDNFEKKPIKITAI